MRYHFDRVVQTKYNNGDYVSFYFDKGKYHGTVIAIEMDVSQIIGQPLNDPGYTQTTHSIRYRIDSDDIPFHRKFLPVYEPDIVRLELKK